jgi:hypothetical protein
MASRGVKNRYKNELTLTEKIAKICIKSQLDGINSMQNVFEFRLRSPDYKVIGEKYEQEEDNSRSKS